MSKLLAEASDPLLDPTSYVEEPEKWLAGSQPSVLAAAKPNRSSPARVDAMSDLMRALFDAGWGRYGWPRALGGLGGTIFHRAAISDCLARHQVRGMALFERVRAQPAGAGAIGFTADHEAERAELASAEPV